MHSPINIIDNRLKNLNIKILTNASKIITNIINKSDSKIT